MYCIILRETRSVGGICCICVYFVLLNDGIRTFTRIVVLRFMDSNWSGSYLRCSALKS